MTSKQRTNVYLQCLRDLVKNPDLQLVHTFNIDHRGRMYRLGTIGRNNAFFEFGGPGADAHTLREWAMILPAMVSAIETANRVS